MMAETSFVRRENIAPRDPPPAVRGLAPWLRAHVLANPVSAFGSLLALVIVLYAAIVVLRFLVFDATWQGDSREACVVNGGACWPFIKAKLGQFIYGFYPAAERWRVNIVFAAAALLLAPLLVPRAPLKVPNAVLFFVLFPIAAFFLLRGGGLDGFGVALFRGLVATLTTSLENAAFSLGRASAEVSFGGALLQGLALALAGTGQVAASMLAALDALRDLFARTGLPFWCDLAATCAVVTGTILAAAGWRAAVWTLGALVLFAGVAFLLRLDSGGLPIVETRLWGGLLVTLVVSITGIVASIPVGIALALGRRSRMPLVRILSVIFIEFWRGVPLVTVLFFATYMLPLFLPGGMSFDALLRALIGTALFAGAYNAEVIRGGLQAIPRGQTEAGLALGLKRSRVTALIVLPQALRHVIPSLVNSFIALFKDTTLVLIVSIFDLLGQLRAAFADPNWLTPSTLFTGFAFAGMIYFVFCFGMSRYALYLETRLGRHRQPDGGG